MILSIEDLENIPANELIISVKMNYDRVLAAVKMIGIVVISHCSFPFSIVDVDIFRVGNPVELKVLPIDLVTAIARGVVCDDCEVVAVVLSENRVEIVLDSKSIVVVVARSDNAHRKFLSHAL